MKITEVPAKYRNFAEEFRIALSKAQNTYLDSCSVFEHVITLPRIKGTLPIPERCIFYDPILRICGYSTKDGLFFGFDNVVRLLTNRLIRNVQTLAEISHIEQPTAKSLQEWIDGVGMGKHQELAMKYASQDYDENIYLEKAKNLLRQFPSSSRHTTKILGDRIYLPNAFFTLRNDWQAFSKGYVWAVVSMLNSYEGAPNRVYTFSQVKDFILDKVRESNIHQYHRQHRIWSEEDKNKAPAFEDPFNYNRVWNKLRHDSSPLKREVHPSEIAYFIRTISSHYWSLTNCLVFIQFPSVLHSHFTIGLDTDIRINTQKDIYQAAVRAKATRQEGQYLDDALNMWYEAFKEVPAIDNNIRKQGWTWWMKFADRVHNNVNILGPLLSRGIPSDAVWDWPGNIPLPTISDVEATLLDTKQAIKAEGSFMGHCIQGHSNRAYTRTAYLFHLEAPKLGLSPISMAFRYQTYVAEGNWEFEQAQTQIGVGSNHWWKATRLPSAYKKFALAVLEILNKNPQLYRKAPIKRINLNIDKMQSVLDTVFKDIRPQTTLKDLLERQKD